MSVEWRVQGPFPLDLTAVAGNVNAVVAQVPRIISNGDRSDARSPETARSQPGLYAVWRVDEQGRWALAGLWFVFAQTWVDPVAAEAEDRHPPYVADALNALTEAVWWHNIPVWPREGGVWRPLCVLEWPHYLANRSALPPPGEPASEDAALDGGAGNWMVPPRQSPARPGDTPTASLPRSRSLIALVRGRMEYDGARHSGTFRLVPPSIFPADAHAPPLGVWWEHAARATLATAPRASEHHLAAEAPLGLFGGRVGFVASGWLTRGLAMAPSEPGDIREGTLHPRDVAGLWRAALVQGVAVVIGVAAGVIALALVIEALSRPSLDLAANVVFSRAQPAMSVCSAENELFMAELRCQLDHIAGGGGVDDVVCRDDGSDATPRISASDAQPAWCGVRDRTLDGDVADAEQLWTWHELAAAKACFNVLRYPYRYARPADPSRPGGRRPDPSRLLGDEALRISDLATLVGALDEACDDARGWMEARLRGAMVATHVGASDADGPSTLRQRALETAHTGLRPGEAACLDAGGSDGVGVATSYDGLCPGLPQPESMKRPAWHALAAGTDAPGDPSGVIERYRAARFARRRSVDEHPQLWRCHAQLADGAPEGVVRTRWDLYAPVLGAYDVTGNHAVHAQLELDAALWSFEERGSGDDCWEVVRERLAAWAPVHPLIGEIDPATWPSEEQQVCGQVCAVRFGVRRAEASTRWVTQDEDLARCLDDGPPPDQAQDPVGRLDRLRLPWNEDLGGESRAAGWSRPQAAEICAFHLVAQGYFPSGDGGVLLGGATPQAWAGEEGIASGIGGGADGLAAIAATGLEGDGRALSVNTCGHVAAQCLATGLLGVTGAGRERYTWQREWNAWVDRMVSDRPAVFRGGAVERYSPWCALVRPYTSADSRLPEGRIEYPCAKGVDDTRRAFETALERLVRNADGGVQ